MERIKYKNEEVAVILRHDHSIEGTEFVSDTSDPLQVGILRRRVGQIAAPRIRAYQPQTIEIMQQVIYVVEGRLRVTLYDERTKEQIQQIELAANDLIFLKKHGHGVEYLDDALILEVKQGPYPGDPDAKTLIKHSKTKI